MVTAYLGALGLLGVERLYELFLSRRNAERVLARGGVEVGHAHFRVMAVVHTLFLFSCGVEVVLLERAFPGALGFGAIAAAIAAQALRYWAIRTLGESWNVRILVVPNAPPVTHGPYRFLRHPNYLAVIVEMIAVPIAHGAWITALLFSIANAALLVVRIRAEERALGEQWSSAFARRPRLLPRLQTEVSS